MITVLNIHAFSLKSFIALVGMIDQFFHEIVVVLQSQ